MPFRSTQSWTNFAIEVSNSRSRNGIYQFGYKLTAFGFWTGEPGFDILRINRGPQSRSRDLQIAIQALKLSSRSSNRHRSPEIAIEVLKSPSKSWNRHRGPQIAIEVLKSPSRSSNRHRSPEIAIEVLKIAIDMLIEKPITRQLRLSPFSGPSLCVRSLAFFFTDLRLSILCFSTRVWSWFFLEFPLLVLPVAWISSSSLYGFFPLSILTGFGPPSFAYFCDP
jgi:hypothetical protein